MEQFFKTCTIRWIITILLLNIVPAVHACRSYTSLWERSAPPLCKEYNFQRKTDQKTSRSGHFSSFLLKRAFHCKLKLSFIPLLEPWPVSDFFSRVILCC